MIFFTIQDRQYNKLKHMNLNQSQFPFQNVYKWHQRTIIGYGGFAKVYKVQNITNNQYYAIKEIDMQKFDSDYKLNALKTQITAMTQCKNDNIVQLLNYHVSKPYTYLVMELCETDVRQILLKYRFLSEMQSIKVICDVLSGYTLLAQKNYVHRDLKPENILLKSGSYKLTDFGFSRKINFNNQKLRQICGTPIYMAPQLFDGRQYTSKCDIWSLGLILYQIIFGYTPWSNRYIDSYKIDVMTRGVSFPYNCKIGKNVQDFITRCLNIQQNQRISLKQIYQHPLLIYKNSGPPIIHKQLDQKIIKILSRVQQSSSRKFINVKELFNKYSNYKFMDERIFYSFLRQLDPQITTYQSRQIFNAADHQRDKVVDLSQFKTFFLDVDYRTRDDITDRRIDQLAKMAQLRNISIQQLFNLLDLNKNSLIEVNEFTSFIKHIAPKLSEAQIYQMFKKFDKNNCETINFNDFVYELTRGTKMKNSFQRISFEYLERAKRNVQCLGIHFRQNSIIPEKILKIESNNSSENKLSPMSIDDFGMMVSSINYYITRDQIIEMFRLIDQDNSETIQAEQICKLIQMQMC